MSKTSSISARISASDKRRTEAVFKKLGITASQAIAMFYKQVQLHNGIPFRVELPNSGTQSAIEEARSLQHDHVGTEHLLLGVLREQDGVAARILLNLGLGLEDVRQAVIDIFLNDDD